MEKIKKKLKNVLENKKLLYNLCLVITIGGLLLIVTGTSYAILSGSTQSNKEQVIKAGEVLIEVTEYFESIGSKVSVMSDEEGLLQEDVYNFKIKNIGDVTAKYDVKLINEVPSSYSDGVIEDKYVKIGLEINGEEHGPFTLEEANNIIDSNIIYKNELVDYNLRIWLNEEYEDELLNMEGYKAFFKISVEAEQSANVEPPASQTIIEKSGTDGIVAEEHPETIQLEANTDYRYTGKDPNNYVSFNNELWRIIGVFPTEDASGNIENRVKIIRDESIGNIQWDNGTSVNSISNSESEKISSSSLINKEIEDNDKIIKLAPGDTGINNWSMSNLQILLNNGDYYNRAGSYSSTGLTSEAKSMINDAKWYLGGSSSTDDVTTSMFYERERGTTVLSERPTSWIGKVGLMYPSDYGYATSGGSIANREACLAKDLPSWSYIGYDYCQNNDWLYDSSQWTITPDSTTGNYVFYVSSSGFVSLNDAYSTYAVRPVLALSSEVQITGGTGTSSDPYTLGI